MADFSYLKELAVTRETTCEYTFDRIHGAPSLVVSPATDDNEDFFNARVELSLAEAPDEGAKPKSKRQSGKANPADIKSDYEKNRDIDCKLISQACIRGWGTPPVDTAGNEVPFSTENAYDFLAALPDYMVDPFRAFCGNIYNFAPKPGQVKPNADKLGKS